MLFKLALIFSFLLAHTALAHRHRRKQPHKESFNQTNAINERDTSSSHAAGAILRGTFVMVSANFNVPVPSGAPGDGATAWVGIDGSSDCPNSFLETGVDFSIGESGEPAYAGWYEWAGADQATFYDILIEGGDDIKLSVTLWSSTEGFVGIENISKNASLAYLIHSDNALCGKSAEWIVDDYRLNGAFVPLVNFDSVTFNNAEATPLGGTPITPNGAEISTIVQNGQTLTSTSIDGSSITVKRL